MSSYNGKCSIIFLYNFQTLGISDFLKKYESLDGLVCQYDVYLSINHTLSL